MRFYNLLKKSKIHFEKHHNVIEKLQISNLFGTGAKWMQMRLQELRGYNITALAEANYYNYYGVLKYLILVFSLLITGLTLYYMNIALIPFTILIFYFVEAHFIFLFPLLIDSAKNPIRESIKLSYKIGIIKAFLNVMPISFFMIIGLLNYKKPLRNWYLGCLAVLIWYEEAIGNRV